MQRALALIEQRRAALGTEASGRPRPRVLEASDVLRPFASRLRPERATRKRGDEVSRSHSSQRGEGRYGKPHNDLAQTAAFTNAIGARQSSRRHAQNVNHHPLNPASEEVQHEPYFPFACVSASMRPERPHKDQSSIGLHHQTCPGSLNGH
jgi:hypothetical protein